MLQPPHPPAPSPPEQLVHGAGQPASQIATWQRDHGRTDGSCFVSGIATAKWKGIKHHIGHRQSDCIGKDQGGCG